MKPKFKEYGEKGNLVKLSFSIYAWFKSPSPIAQIHTAKTLI
jgi:hypothetical protein